jgi:hypothetical protein
MFSGINLKAYSNVPSLFALRTSCFAALRSSGSGGGDMVVGGKVTPNDRHVILDAFVTGPTNLLKVTIDGAEEVHITIQI